MSNGLSLSGAAMPNTGVTEFGPENSLLWKSGSGQSWVSLNESDLRGWQNLMYGLKPVPFNAEARTFRADTSALQADTSTLQAEAHL